MAVEIERKFLVRGELLPPLDQGTRIRQGYIPTLTGTTVRVRIAGELAFLCIKSRISPLTRKEYEFPIPLAEADEMLNSVCHVQCIVKDRYLIPHAGLTWEVDIFYGDNEGLRVAEVELLAENQQIEFPSWVGEEVSLDPRYSNSSLALNPCRNW